MCPCPELSEQLPPSSLPSRPLTAPERVAARERAAPSRTAPEPQPSRGASGPSQSGRGGGGDLGRTLLQLCVPAGAGLWEQLRAASGFITGKTGAP